MKIKCYIIQFLITVVLIVLAVFLYHMFFSKKLGYVKTGIILEKYEEMKNANETFLSELNIVQNNIDTLKKRLESLRLQEGSIPAPEKKSWAMELGARENELRQYSQTAEEQLKSRRVELTEKVVMQINKTILEYGQSCNYSYIFGTTADGNIIYAEEADDLTDVIIDILNTKPAEE